MKRLVVGCLLALTPCLAQAGDAEAQEHWKQAVAHWKDADPTVAVEHAEKAVAEAESKTMRMNALLLLGRLHQGKTGNFDEALKAYEKIIRSNIGATSPNLKSLKAQALIGKGTIYYSERDDLDTALSAYQAAHHTYRSAHSADLLAQLCFRIGRDKTRSEAARAKQLEYSEKLSREALHHDAENRAKTANAAQTAKYRLQLVICLYAEGKKDEAEAAWSETHQDKLTPDAAYQLAVLKSLRGDGPEAVAAELRRCLDPDVRPKARARNQLRKFVRTEPDFSDFTDREDWKDLTEDEPEE